MSPTYIQNDSFPDASAATTSTPMLWSAADTVGGSEFAGSISTA